jgi:hypothetical protein
MHKTTENRYKFNLFLPILLFIVLKNPSDFSESVYVILSIRISGPTITIGGAHSWAVTNSRSTFFFSSLAVFLGFQC